MDNPLSCNNLKCRKELTDRAAVTTCSHIFCFECVERLGLAGPDNQRRNTCPVCKAQLAKQEDVVYTNLNPTEEYKTCVLSGLNPNTVMECAGRAISFWAYQTTQNLYYQQHLYKSISEKYSELWARCDQITRDAEARINALHEKLESMTNSRDTLQRKNVEFAEALKDKNRKLSQTQELYNKVKRKAELGQIERAACDAVGSSIRMVPQPAMNSQEPHALLPAHLYDANERSYPLSHGLGLDATGFTKRPSGSGLQQSERDGPWVRTTPTHGFTPATQSYRHTANGQGRADFFHPNIVSNTGLPRVDSMRQSSVDSPGCSQRGNPWAGVGLTSGLKVGQPTGHTGANGRLESL